MRYRSPVPATATLTAPVDRARPGRRQVAGFGGLDLVGLATRLARAGRWPGADALSRRSWRLMARGEGFDAWLIAWPAGGKVDLHDHAESSGAIRVIEGVLTEAVPKRDRQGRLTLARAELGAGATATFGAGHVHDVANESDRPALSLHVYSPALTSMSFFDLDGDRLVARADRWEADGELVAPALPVTGTAHVDPR